MPVRPEQGATPPVESATTDDNAPLATVVGAGTQINQAGEQRSSRVESLRAIAALGVLGGHIWERGRAVTHSNVNDTFPHRLVDSGGYGVFLFFALTGYLLFLPFARQAFGGRRIDLRRYALNRVLRILPLYYAMVVIWMIFQARPSGGTFSMWWRYLLFAQNTSRHTQGYIDAAMWSLTVEVQFYILLPFFAAALRKVTRGSLRAGFAWMLGLGVLAAAVHYGATGARFDTPAKVWEKTWAHTLPLTFVFFVPGMLLAMVQVAWAGRRPAWLGGVLARSDAWILASLVFFLITVDNYRHDTIFVLFSFLLVGGAVLPLEPGLLVRALSWKPLAMLGVASYSLYLWHGPLVEKLQGATWRPTGTTGLLLVSVPVVIPVAFASYYIIESPFLRLRRRWDRPSGALPTATAAAPASGGR